MDAAYRKLAVADRTRAGYTLADMVATLAELPLEFSPGTRWNYSVATDVVGHLIEVISGQRLDAYLAEHVFGPLGMRDTGFAIRDEQVPRFAANYERQADGSAEAHRRPHAQPVPAGELPFGRRRAGLHGADYHRFTAMLLNGGELDGMRLLGRKTVELMTAESPAGRAGCRAARPAGHVHGDALCGPRIRARLLGRAVAGPGARPGQSRRVRLGRRCEHGVLDRSRRGPHRHLHDAAHARPRRIRWAASCAC